MKRKRIRIGLNWMKKRDGWKDEKKDENWREWKNKNQCKRKRKSHKSQKWRRILFIFFLIDNSMDDEVVCLSCCWLDGSRFDSFLTIRLLTMMCFSVVAVIVCVWTDMMCVCVCCVYVCMCDWLMNLLISILSSSLIIILIIVFLFFVLVLLFFIVGLDWCWLCLCFRSSRCWCACL